jgi:uncharacterized protein
VRVVFDTNVLLAGIFTRGICEALLDECLGNPDHSIFTSPYILSEFSRNAIAKFGMPAGEARKVVEFLKNEMEQIEPAHVPATSCKDPGDLEILGTALSAQADCLVSGDRDLLELGKFRSIPILTPRAFHDLLRLK